MGTARTLNLPRFTIDEPCKNGHLSERFSSDGTCVKCRKDWDAKRRLEAPHKRNGNVEYYTKYRAENRDKAKIHRAKWFAENRDRNNQYGHAYRSKLRGAGGKYTTEDIGRILKSQRRRCAYCRCSLKGRNYEIDHIVAVSNGGSNNPSNIQILCRSCNRRKHTKDPILFAQEFGMMI